MTPTQLPTYEAMKGTKRWLMSSPGKVPFYLDGEPRSGKLDTPEDMLRLGTFDQAVAACARKGEG